MPVQPEEFAAALRQYAAGVCLLTVRDDIDDVGTTVTSVMSASADPPLVAVGLAADGYPNNVIKGAAIPQIPVDESSHVYYAGVSSTEHGGLMASSGRVLLVETTADDIKAAQDKVYAIIDKLDTSGMFYRHDIGAKALNA